MGFASGASAGSGVIFISGVDGDHRRKKKGIGEAGLVGNREGLCRECTGLWRTCGTQDWRCNGAGLG